MASYWLRMTSSGDDIWPRGSTGLLTDKTTKNKPKQNQEPRPPIAAQLIIINKQTNKQINNSVTKATQLNVCDIKYT